MSDYIEIGVTNVTTGNNAILKHSIALLFYHTVEEVFPGVRS